MWFRSDLRMHDNAALAAADKEGSSLLAVRLSKGPDILNLNPHFSLLQWHSLIWHVSCMCLLPVKDTPFGVQ